MSNYTYDLNDGSGACSLASYCSGRSIGAGTVVTCVMGEALGASLGLKAYTLNASETNVITGGFFGVVPSGVNQIDAQTIATKFRVGAAGAGSPSLTEIHLCVLSSACANLRTIGSITGLTTALAGGGEFTNNVTVAAPVAVAPGDVIAMLIVMSNLGCPVVNQNFSFNPVVQTVIAMSEVAATDDELPLLGAG